MANSFGTETAEQIIKEYADMIYRIALHNLKNTADADDILQEVCIALITKNPPVDDKNHLKHWLIRVTINKCNSFHRSIWQSKRECIDDYTHLEAPQQQTVIDEVRQLPKNYRNIIYLYYYESYTIAEIAEILNKSPNTISSGLQRARKKLKKLLIEGGYNNA
ncbi:MAG: sigma-70 family RNA polymerase sigma factor [Ruminococcus sp.]|nr:sigma-70 family RNA polymerase sigma factor [Ruminococcus sp.]